MTSDSVPDDDVQIFAPSYALRKKIGNVNIDQILSPAVVEAAQAVIAGSAGQLMEEAVAGMQRLDQIGTILKANVGDGKTLLPETVALAFAVKTKAGLGGYELVGKIAKSLQLYCEALDNGELTPRNRQLIIWHIDSLGRLLTLKKEGLGGALGEEILAELAKLERNQ